MSCEHDCDKPPLFPKTIFNRPGLPKIDYSIGAYARLREHMLAALDQAPLLSTFTHRHPDDPAIALLESAAIVGDILTFYQTHYANELYLRTAQWRESVAELVRLLGYRLAPGLGGEALFALAVKGDQPVVVPKGFGLKAQLKELEKPAEFESAQEVTALPHLSAFHLYRPRHTPTIVNGTKTFYVDADGGIPAGLTLKKGDRLMLGKPHASFSARLQDARVVVVEKSWQEFGQLYVTITTPLHWSGSTSQLQAYKLGDSHRHFGHNAPPIYQKISGSTTVAASTWYFRDDWEGDTSSFFYNMDFSVRQQDMPLDEKTSSIVEGNYILMQATISTRYPSGDFTSKQAYTLVGKVASVSEQTMTFGSVSGPSTVLSLEQKTLAMIGDNTSYYDAFRIDIRSINFHEVAGEPFVLRAQHQPTSVTEGNDLYYFGTDADVQSLLGRPLLLHKSGELPNKATATAVQSLAPADAARELMRRVTLDTSVTYVDFPYADPPVTVYGNVIPATQGKTQTDVVLGSGDNRADFQTFAVPKDPLTYLLDETQTPAQVPALHVYVDGLEWQHVDSFFNYGPNDTVYVVREDEANKSFVQFGDGKNGRRLPSGRNNVSAVYRMGNAAHGEAKDGTKPQITGKLANFDKLFLHAPVTGGADAEDGRNARVAAPGKMQSLGRMVSLADIEAETLALPQVIKVRANWSAPEGVPLVLLTVLTQSGDVADVNAVRESVQTYNRCRGPSRFPIDVVQGSRQYVFLHIEAGVEAARRESDVLIAIKQALGLAGEEGNGIDGSNGLFGLPMRQFGSNVHKSQIIAAVQNAVGVTWVKLRAAQNLNLGTPPETDPAQLAVPTVEIVNDVLACANEYLLALHTEHLVLSLVKDDVAKECQS
jgi:hypothetical protein